MIRLAIRRLLMAPPVIFSIVTLVFFMTQLIPGDQARIAAGRDATLEQVEAMRIKLGLDDPLYIQFAQYLDRLRQGDLGISVFTYRPVLTDLADVLPSSIELVVLAMAINLVISLPAAMLTAAYRGRRIDRTVRILVLFGGTVPVFWLGLTLQNVFGARIQILPIAGQHKSGDMVPRRTGATTLDSLLTGDFSIFLDSLTYVILPALTLSCAFIAVLTRTLRSSMIGVLDSDFVMVARAKGASNLRVLVRHALPNAAIPTLTIVGMQVGWMLGSTILVESIFGRQGIGSYAMTAVLQKDIFAVIAAVLILGIAFTLLNLIVDLLVPIIDPRLRRAHV